MSRYIDADKLRQDILLLPNCYNGFSDTYDKACIIDEIDEQPTADVRKNVRGEWIRRKDTIQCSQCKAKWIDHTYLIETFRFCPNCGADMRPVSALSENAEIVSKAKGAQDD